MEPAEKRRYPRVRVRRIIAQLAPDRRGVTTAVIDLSEGGAGLHWTVPEHVALGAPVRVRFILAGGQTIDVDGRVARVGAGRAGIEFLPRQQDVVRQLLAEARSEE